MKLKYAATAFLATFQEDEYFVITHQYPLFTQYETLLRKIYQCSTKPVEKETALSFAYALFKSANIYRRIATDESLEKALQYLQASLNIKKKILTPYDLELAHNLIPLGATYNELKGEENNTNAIKHYQEALTIYTHNQTTEKRYLINTLNNLGNAYHDLSEANIPTAIEYLDRALELCSTEPIEKNIWQEHGKALYNQGVNYHLLGNDSNLKKAINYLCKAKKLFEHNHDFARLSITLSYLGDVYRCLGNDKNITLSIDCLNSALQMQKDLFGQEHTEVAKTLYNLGNVFYDKDQDKNLVIAQEYFTQALKIQQKLLRKDHPHIVKTLNMLAMKK